MPQLNGPRHRVTCVRPSKRSAHAAKGWMVRGYLAASISASASASAVTQPAQIFTRGNTAASRTSVSMPDHARRHAVVLPLGPPPTAMTSGDITRGAPRRLEDRAHARACLVPARRDYRVSQLPRQAQALGEGDAERL